jgi:Lrp/AsnC family transcriptional regulator, regulator for asnA, asnC and gidA
LTTESAVNSIRQAKLAARGRQRRSAPTAGVGESALDEIDRRLVHLLQRDGRQSNVQIARLLRLGESTVRRRVERLIRDGIIQVVAVAEPLKVGYPIYALIAVKTQPGSVRAVASRLRSLRQVMWLGIVAGQYDVLLAAGFEAPAQLLDFMDSALGRIRGISSTETFYILDVVKRAFEWRLPEVGAPDGAARRSARERNGAG